MGGVDVADQRLGAHAHVHKPMTYFWRRVFDQKFSQAVSNAYLLFVEWAEMLLRQCTAALESATEDGAQEGERGAVVNDCVFTAPELKEFEALLKKALKIEGVQWDQRLANHLMSLCAVGHIDKGARRTAEVVHSYLVNGARSPKVCHGGTCAKKTSGTSRYTGSRTRGVCWCNVCTKFEGKAKALHLCSRCQKVYTAHVEAARVAAAKKKYAPISWAEVPPA